MVDRRFIGDLMLAVLISVPSVALAHQVTFPNREAPAVQKSVIALAPAADRQVGLFR